MCQCLRARGVLAAENICWSSARKLSYVALKGMLGNLTYTSRSQIFPFLHFLTWDSCVTMQAKTANTSRARATWSRRMQRRRQAMKRPSFYVSSTSCQRIIGCTCCLLKQPTTCLRAPLSNILVFTEQPSNDSGHGQHFPKLYLTLVFLSDVVEISVVMQQQSNSKQQISWSVCVSSRLLF